MSVGEWVEAARRAWVGMLAAAMLGIAGASVLLVITPPAYEAVARILFEPGTDGAAFNPRLTATNAAAIVRSEGVLADVAQRFDVGRDDLARGASATWIPETSMTAVTVTSSSPDIAADLATALAEEAAATSGPGMRVTIIDAESPESPVSPQPHIVLAVGALLGVAAAVVYAASRTALSRRVTSVDDAARRTRSPAFPWAGHEPTSRAARDLRLLVHAWADGGRAISLLPVGTEVDTAALTAVIGVDTGAVELVENGPLFDEPVSAAEDTPVVLVVEVGRTTRRDAQLAGQVLRQQGSRARGVIAVVPRMRTRMMPVMSEPENGDPA